MLNILSKLKAGASGVFAEDVRYSTTAVNGDRLPHVERCSVVSFGHLVLEDKDRFHEAAERVRVNMLKQLKDSGAPLNVWRIGKMAGVVSSVTDLQGEVTNVPGECTSGASRFYVRTRASTESQRPEPV